MRGVCALLLAASGCSLYYPGEEPTAADAAVVPPDGAHAPVPFQWIVAASEMEPGVQVLLDSAHDDWTSDRYPSDEDVPVEHTIATVVGLQTISHVVVHPDCDELCGPGDYLEKKEHWFAYASGELRQVSTTCDSAAGECTVVDADEPLCHRDGCPGARCGIDRVDYAQDLGWLACVPIGPVAVDGACTIDEDGIDDCGANLHCVGGTCRPACELREHLGDWSDGGDCGGAGACAHVDGMSPEVGICS